MGDDINGVFIELPEEAIKIIDLCDGSRTLKVVQDLLEIELGESFEVIEFITDLLELNLIYKIDDCIISERNIKKHFKFTKFMAHFLYNKNMHIVYGILILFNIYMMFIVKSNLPNYKNAEIISGHSGWSLMCFSLISIVITVFHELGHYLSAVELNIPVKIKLNLRLIFLVIETDINSIWGVERKKRYICYLAGFYLENIILLISFLVKKFCFPNILTTNICNAIILTVFLNFIWQFMIFLRTDFYYILLNYLNIPALHFTATQLVKNMHKNIKNKFDIKVYVYLCIYIMGSIASVVYFINELFIYANLIKLSVYRFELNIDNICFYTIMFLNLVMWGKGAYNKYTDYKYEKNNKMEA